MSDRIKIEKSSGNVFADIGVRDPEEALAKAKLAGRIREIARERKLTQVQLARTLEIDQPNVSRLMRGRLRGFSTDRLCHFLTRLDQDVRIEVRPSAGKERPSVTVETFATIS